MEAKASDLGETLKKDTPGIIIGKLMNIGGLLQREGNRLLQPFGLNHQQFSVFFEIAKAGKVKQKDMVNRLLLEKAHVSKVVKKLYQMGLISISETPEDKRSFWLSLTADGEETLARCRAVFRDRHREWTCDLGEAELFSLLETLARLQKVFKEKIR